MMESHAAKQILSLYERHADAFARLRSRSLFEQKWLDKFTQQLRPGGSILDIGCGNGQPIADYFIRSGFQLTGVDGAAAMISRARAHFPEQRWLHHDMRQLAMEETFDGLIAWDSFFHLTQEDQRAMFAIFAAHSHAGSALMFTSGTSNGTAMGTFGGEPLYHASLAPEEYREILAQHQFSVIDVQFEDPECGHHSIWLFKKAN